MFEETKPLVRLYAVDTETLAPQFEQLVERVDRQRRERVLAFGKTPAGLRCLGAGLLLTQVADAQTLNECLRLGEHGKPEIANHTPFNLTHADRFAVLATAEQSVGVDMESSLHPTNYFNVAARFFHPDEVAYVESAANPQDAFFVIWALKESYLKAEGSGFSRGPGSFAVLPEGTDGGAANWETDYRFRRYRDFLPEYHLAVCSRDGAFCQSVEMVTF